MGYHAPPRPARNWRKIALWTTVGLVAFLAFAGILGALAPKSPAHPAAETTNPVPTTAQTTAPVVQAPSTPAPVGHPSSSKPARGATASSHAAAANPTAWETVDPYVQVQNDVKTSDGVTVPLSQVMSVSEGACKRFAAGEDYQPVEAWGSAQLSRYPPGIGSDVVDFAEADVCPGG